MENIWLYVAVGIVVFALYEGLLGLWKGIYKTTTKYLVIGGITLCLVFMMPVCYLLYIQIKNKTSHKN